MDTDTDTDKSVGAAGRRAPPASLADLADRRLRVSHCLSACPSFLALCPRPFLSPIAAHCLFLFFIQLADFGLARLFSNPLHDMTPRVVTLWSVNSFAAALGPLAG